MTPAPVTLVTAAPVAGHENEIKSPFLSILNVELTRRPAYASRDRRPSDTPSAQSSKEDVMRSRKAANPNSRRTGMRLSLSEPAIVQTKVQKLQLAIARRAHELFEARGQERGHDLDDWLQAESELLCPVSIAMSQSKDCVKLHASVAGFDASEIEVSVEPGRVMILGKKAQNAAETEAGTSEPSGSRPNQILQVIDLATEVVPERAIVELKAGELICELPAVSTNKIETAA